MINYIHFIFYNLKMSEIEEENDQNENQVF